MSEQPTAAPAARKKAPGKTYAGLTRNQWLIAGGVGVAALIFIVWRRRKAAAASTQTAPTNQGSNECTDAQGNPVDCNQAFAGELADLANALDQLQAQGGGAGGTGVTGTVSTLPATVPPSTVSGAPAVTQPAATPVTSSGATATKAPAKTPPPTPTGVHATAVTKSSITIAWNRVAGATGYQIRVTYQSKFVKQQASTSTTATISGLGADHTYGIHVAATGPGGTSPEGNVDIKTAKL